MAPSAPTTQVQAQAANGNSNGQVPAISSASGAAGALAGWAFASLGKVSLSSSFQARFSSRRTNFFPFRRSFFSATRLRRPPVHHVRTTYPRILRCRSLFLLLKQRLQQQPQPSPIQQLLPLFRSHSPIPFQTSSLHATLQQPPLFLRQRRSKSHHLSHRRYPPGRGRRRRFRR